MTTGNTEDVARRLITAAGGRQTRPRIAALVALMESGRVASHADLHRRLHDLDRVSLYRALDWLADHQLAHRVTDADGVRRYGPSQAGETHKHPHFQCTRCGLTTCLEQSKTLPIRLPQGFRQAAMDVLVKGLCKTCTTI
jgi:Fur family ferric uptake transcriptional regulator